MANEACDAGHVSVNGKVARASLDVSVGDVIEVAFGERRLKVKVLDVRESVGKNDALSLYEVIA